jgi:hypothetical protein
MTLLGTRIDEAADETGAVVRVGVAASLASAHLLDPAPIERRHGSGLDGVVTPLGTLEVHSLVRGPWEVRLARLVSLEAGVDPAGLRLRVGGWAVSGAEAADEGDARASAASLTSTLVPLLGDAHRDVVVRADASPLGAASAVPVLEFAAEPGVWIAALVELRGVPAERPTASATVDDARVTTVTWPDGVRTASRLHDSGSATAADR